MPSFITHPLNGFNKVNVLYRGMVLAHSDVLGLDPATESLYFRGELRQEPK